MKDEGNTGAYVAATHGLPIPHIQTTGIRPTHAPQDHKKDTTFDWDAHTPTCTICGQKSGTVAEGVCAACKHVAVPTLSLVTNNTPQTSASAAPKSTDHGPADHTHQDETTGNQGTVPLQLPTKSPSTAEAEPTIHTIRAQLQRTTSAQTLGDAFRVLADAACTLALLFDQIEEAHKPAGGGVSRLSPPAEPTGPGTGEGSTSRVQSATNHRTNKEGHN